MDYADWNRGLLLGGLLVVIATMAMISGRTVRHRLLAVGVLGQGIVMLLVSGAVYYPRAELGIAALALLTISGLWSLWFIPECRSHSQSPDAVTSEPVPGKPGVLEVTSNQIQGAP
ncbi:MAG: hypothetical protein JSS49_00350 [Planctomycetes bacterium]|nr:hypothetical protein [Planctomycetota bacterium]